MDILKVLRLAALLLVSGVVYANASLAQTTSTPAYDVVSVKPNKTGGGDSSWGNDDGSFRGTNVAVKWLIQDAYGLPTDDLISGMPGWSNATKFDIEAKLDAETIAALKSLSKEERAHREDLMLQALLADRFHLKVHRETRELQVYQLVVTRSGSKMTDAKTDDGGSLNVNNRNLTATGAAMENFCQFLSQQLHRKVEDKTGLTGKYDFTMQWSPDEAAGESVGTTGASPLPSLFTALQEQLGLKLDSSKGNVDVVVVDRIAIPSEN